MSNKKPYGNTVKPVIMKYYSITVSKLDWNNAVFSTHFVACVCAETCKSEHFMEEISIQKKIYPVAKMYTERQDENSCSYLGTDGLIHRIECELAVVYLD